MAQPNSSAVQSRFLLKDIILERTDKFIEYRQSLNVTEIWVAGIPFSPNGKCLVLTHISSRRWERWGSIELPHEGLVCIFKCEDGENVGFMQLGSMEIRASKTDSEKRFRKGVRTCDPKVHVTVSCEVAEVPLSSTSEPNNLATQLADRGIMLRHRFKRTGNFADIAEAIAIQERAVALTPPGHPLLPERLSDLGNSFTSRFQWTGDLSHIARAISTQQQAVNLTPESDAGFPDRLNNLGLAMLIRYERTGNLPEISQAIAVIERAVSLTPQSHPKIPQFLSNLGSAFSSRFDRTGDPADIAKCILAQQKAVELTPEGHETMPTLLLNLGNAFRLRFEQSADIVDITEAISAHTEAVELTREDHHDTPRLLNALGNSLGSRFGWTREDTVITASISALHKSVELTPANHPDLPDRFINLGVSYMRRFELGGELSDIEEAVSAQMKAVALTPENMLQASMLNNLAISLVRRFGRTGDISDVVKAEKAHQKAVELTPEGHENLPSLLNNVANTWRVRFERSHNLGDMEKCISNYKSAATCTVGSSLIKLEAAQNWARLLNIHFPKSPQVLPAFDTTLGYIALHAGLEQTVQGRYIRLQSVPVLALNAAAAACSLDRPDKALEFLEQGRCLVWGQLNNLRTPLDELRSMDGNLADRIADISKRLENAASSRVATHTTMSLSGKIALEDESHSRLKLAQQWDELLKTARAIPGFENFLKPSPSSALLRHLPASGPIVVINVDERRCDTIALLASFDEPLHIPLPNFSLDKAKKYRTDLKILLCSGGLRTRNKDASTVLTVDPPTRPIKPLNRARRDAGVLHEVLSGLWNDVVKPILDALSLTRVDPTSTEVLPRIWWCPTGAMSFLPLHAAGIYTGSKSESILDYAVSSYTPTVTAISSRINNNRAIDKSVSGLFLTSQPNAPGATSIPGTTQEVQSIHSMAREEGTRVLKLEGSDVTVGGCLEHMEHFSSVHLACHASQDAADPLQSRFLLHNGSLDLATILQSNLKNADLAFLSACQTSTGEEKLSDEAVHLAAGMLAAGYRRVVATMWSIGDQSAQEVANTFYEYLWSHREGDSDGGFDGTLSAYALHHAVQQLRRRLDNSESALLTWVPYVHFGY
ncbi:CHAT domain-containing protein [Ephemerocybe angulata]|uniref:CHAT domain-containing protein n=1 Tax=Ephemerocybe angulata TaxID=980116 RepID=A0A8H6HV74_9AGAR|nr:CHAT domain-containing protein [Tulosesus angulatus]